MICWPYETIWDAFTCPPTTLQSPVMPLCVPMFCDPVIIYSYWFMEYMENRAYSTIMPVAQCTALIAMLALEELCAIRKNMFLDISTDWSTRWIWGAVGTRIKIWLATSIKHQHQCPWNRDRLPMTYFNDASGSSAKQPLNFNGSLDNLPQ